MGIEKKKAGSEETKNKLLGGCKSPEWVVSVYSAWKSVLTSTSQEILAELKHYSNLGEEIKCVANASFTSMPAADFAWKQMPKIPEHFRGRVASPLVACTVASEYMGRSTDMINA